MHTTGNNQAYLCTMNTDIEVVNVTNEPAKKCAYCRFRVTERWKFGQKEPDEYAMCSQCTLHLLIDKQKQKEGESLTVNFNP